MKNKNQNKNKNNDIGIYNKYINDNDSYLSLHIIKTIYKRFVKTNQVFDKNNKNQSNLYQLIDDALLNKKSPYKKMQVKKDITLKKVTFIENDICNYSTIEKSMYDSYSNTNISTNNKYTNTNNKEILNKQTCTDDEKINSNNASMYNRINNV